MPTCNITTSATTAINTTISNLSHSPNMEDEEMNVDNNHVTLDGDDDDSHF